MSLAATRRVELDDGRVFDVKPITVRQRMVLQNRYVERERKRAADDAKAASLSGPAAAEYITDARRKADNLGALVLWAFSVDGILEILLEAVGGEKAEEMVREIELKEASLIALAALGVDLDRYTDKDAPQGNE
jgi:3-oxoacyl-[acyl-carrier-protein] synthase III